MQATDLSSDRCEMHHLMQAADKNERQSHPLHHIVALEATGFATGGAEMICVGLAMAAPVSVKRPFAARHSSQDKHFFNET